MNILFCGEHYWPEVGGLERSTERLAIALKNFKHRVEILTKSHPNQSQESWRNNIRIRRYKDDISSPFTDKGLKDTNLCGLDIICLFGIGQDKNARQWDPIFSSGIPSALKIGTSGDTEVKGVSHEKYGRFGGILCQNPDIAREVINIGVEKERCYEIRNGLDINSWREKSPTKIQARKQIDIDPDYFVISGIGRFVKRKNFHKIIEGFYEFLRNYNGSHHPLLLLQGSDFGQEDGVESQLIEQLSSSIPPQYYRLLPASEETEIALAASNAFITLGEREGAPNIILEAHALGIPVVATDIPGHRVYINESGNNGKLIPIPIQTHDIKAAFLSMSIGNIDGNKIIESSRRFDIEETAKGYLRAFTKIISHP